MEIEHEQLLRLLAEPPPEAQGSVSRWLDLGRDANSPDVTQADVVSSTFGYACALLCDARITAAIKDLRNVLGVLEGGTSLYEPLVRIGLGTGFNFIRRFARAEGAFTAAMKDAKHEGRAATLLYATIQRTLNESDWGRKAWDPVFETEVVAGAQFPQPLADALEAHRVIGLGKLLVRRGGKHEALAAIERFAESERFGRVGPILRGHVCRQRGILLDMSYRPAEARHWMETALGIFHECGFAYGEVQSALSLGRLNTWSDHRQSLVSLERAKAILDETDLTEHCSDVQKRQMPLQRAELDARLADYWFAQGDFRRAADHAQANLKVTEGFARASAVPGESERSLPRQCAYSHRTLGRILLALRRPEAVDHYRTSVSFFEQVGDGVNVLLGGVFICEALLAFERFAELREELGKLRPRVAGTDHLKERAIVLSLDAALVWRDDRDPDTALAKIDEAKVLLERHGRDYHYARTLLLEAEVHEAAQDRSAAIRVLLDARRCANLFDMQDVRRDVELRLQRIGADERDVDLAEKTDLERRCEAEGLVKTEITVFFADVRGFTALSSSVTPTVLAEFIGEFARGVGRGVGLHHGKPLRFLGDCVMAVFGMRSGPNPDREVDALAAVVDVYERFDKLRKRSGLAVGLGFGIATGEVVAGRYGVAELGEFSVIGEPVNRASRLQGTAADGQVVLSVEAARAVKERMPGFPLEEKVYDDLKGLGRTEAWVTSVEQLRRGAAARRAG